MWQPGSLEITFYSWIMNFSAWWCFTFKFNSGLFAPTYFERHATFFLFNFSCGLKTQNSPHVHRMQKEMYEHNIECNTLCWILMHKEFCMFALRQSLDNFQMQPKNLLYYIIIIFQFSHFVYFASCAVFCLIQYFKLDYQMNEIRWKCFLCSIQISRKFCHLPSKISNENINNALDGKWKYLLWRCGYASRRVVFSLAKKVSNSWESCVCVLHCVVRFGEEKEGIKTTSWLVYVFHWVDFSMKQYQLFVTCITHGTAHDFIWNDSNWWRNFLRNNKNIFIKFWNSYSMVSLTIWA